MKNGINQMKCDLDAHISCHLQPPYHHPPPPTTTLSLSSSSSSSSKIFPFSLRSAFSSPLLVLLVLLILSPPLSTPAVRRVGQMRKGRMNGRSKETGEKRRGSSSSRGEMKKGPPGGAATSATKRRSQESLKNPQTHGENPFKGRGRSLRRRGGAYLNFNALTFTAADVTENMIELKLIA